MYASRSAMQHHTRKLMEPPSVLSIQSQSHQPPPFLPTPRPPFLSAIRQKYSSSSSSSHSQSLQSEPSATALHQSSSSASSLSSNEQDETNDETNNYEKRLLREVEIIDENGNIIRIIKMRTKDVHLLNVGEKILVHVNNLDKPIKAARGLCTRFMTRLLQEPNTSLPSARDWRECKLACGVTLLVELRRRFSLPQSENVDRVLFSIWDRAFRSVKFNLKTRLFKSVVEELNKFNNMGDDDVAHGRVYTGDELLQGLDLIKAPPNFTNSQWNLYKDHLRAPATKKLSDCGKRARADQVHNHTTGGCSYARKRDEFKLIHNREPIDLEFFRLAYEKKNGRYVTETSRKLMDHARKEVSIKVLAFGNSEPMNLEKQSEIAREVMTELLGPNKPGRARLHGAGVTKSQVTKFGIDIRKMRGDAVTKENRFLLDKVDYQNKKIESQSKQIEIQSKQMEMQSRQIEMQSKQIEMQSKQIETQNKQMRIMEPKVNDCTGEFRVFRTAFQGVYSTSTSGDMFYTTPRATREGLSGTQPSSGASQENGPY